MLISIGFFSVALAFKNLENHRKTAGPREVNLMTISPLQTCKPTTPKGA
jgi:hypothetical protein